MTPCERQEKLYNKMLADRNCVHHLFEVDWAFGKMWSSIEIKQKSMGVGSDICLIEDDG